MYARLGFSIAVHVDPDVLMVDEILAVGDESFQRRCYERIDDMKAQGRTMILVSHALDAIREHCLDCAWLDHGQVMAIGPATRWCRCTSPRCANGRRRGWSAPPSRCTGQLPAAAGASALAA